MKLKIEKINDKVKKVILECSPAEALVLNHAMRLYSEDDEVHELNRQIMNDILDVKPEFIESEG